ncbi:uncharacterized protein J4E78_006732 [Alternaria triticimaculans]|uniref:uncharacterized protein n=1 Tax=Alternaria triticimaculans TaxID=297637 RepID=UPI0020C3D246|nr:uncharacterized protein J4E78_006732 [Alternaria triticimaculans]KAI4656841.1 hypothetical protein J4E78_006732 [Alternaria triticimaculans]
MDWTYVQACTSNHYLPATTIQIKSEAKGGMTSILIMTRTFDSSATGDLNHNATFLEHNSYWNIFVGTEGANASSTEYSNGLDPFSGFDIPFWFDQEQHWDFT